MERPRRVATRTQREATYVVPVLPGHCSAVPVPYVEASYTVTFSERLESVTLSPAPSGMLHDAPNSPCAVAYISSETDATVTPSIIL